MSPHDISTDGLVTAPSVYRAAETVKRLQAHLAERNLHLFAHIDHTAGATRVGLSLRPTQLVIFGNPRAGTTLIQAAQMIGLDLPLRVLFWEDEAGRVSLTYTDPQHLARRYGIADGDKEVEAMHAGLASLVHAAGS